MGKALYRTHRSKSFDEVIGQSHITDTLKNAIKKGTISHAYLFTGPRGVGKTSIARILAHAINDLPYSDEATHLDIIEIDAASNRRIDEIRDLRDKVHIAPTSAKYKVYIIDEVHMLTREAFNALLKTLEEPPEHVIFILATTEAHKIPDTIMSRTQRFTFRPIEQQAAIDHLRSIAKDENIQINDEALALIAKHGNGSFRDSISMLDQLSGIAKESYDAQDVSLLLGLPAEEVIESLMSSLELNDSDALFDAVRSMKEQGVDVNEAARAVSLTLREQIINKSLRLDQVKILTLLKELLPLTAGAADYTALELSLLGAIDLSSHQKQTPAAAAPTQPTAHKPKADHTPIKKQPDQTKSTSASVAVAEKPPTKPVADDISTETTSEDPVSDPSSSTPDGQVSASPLPEESTHEPTAFSPQSWISLLDDMKSKHNTLYGVLRMAEAVHDGEKLILNFRFGFHKKRIDAPQNSAIIRKFMSKHFGVSDFTTVVSKNNASAPKEVTKAPEPPAELDISSVSNIFGGAELLES